MNIAVRLYFVFGAFCPKFQHFSPLVCATMASTSSADVKNLFEIKRFEGTGFDLWMHRMQGILFLKALEAQKPEDMTDAAWLTLNKKAITYIKMAASDEILVDLKGLTNAFAMWGKLKAMNE